MSRGRTTLEGLEGPVRARGGPVSDEEEHGAVALQAMMTSGGNLGMLQLRADADGERSSAHEVAAVGVAGAGSALPYLDAIQASFGSHDVTQVRSETGGPAVGACKALGAQAYATGDRVAFAAAPSLHTAAHEAAHVVQQRAGVHLAGGVGAAGDPYERHADAVADRVVQGQSAEDLLSHQGNGSVRGAGVQRRSLQFDVGSNRQAGPDVDEIGEGGRGCGAGQEFVPLLETLRAAMQDMPALVEQLRTLGPAQLTAVSEVFSSTSAQTGRWTADERALFTESFARHLAGEGAGAMSYAGDPLGAAAAINAIGNPEPVSKVIIGLVLIGVGFVVREHNRAAAADAAVMRAEMLRRGVGAATQELGATQERSASQLIDALLAASLSAHEIAWSGGFLDGLMLAVEHCVQDLELICSSAGPESERLQLDRTRAQGVAELLGMLGPQAQRDIQTLNRLPGEARSQADAMFALAVGSYIRWLAASAGVAVASTITCDFQSGGNAVQVMPPRCTGIGDASAADLSSTTKNFATYDMGRYLAQGVPYLVTADVTVHDYATAPGAGAYGIPAGAAPAGGADREPITATDRCVFRVTAEGAQLMGSSNAGARVPTEAVHQYFMGFRM